MRQYEGGGDNNSLSVTGRFAYFRGRFHTGCRAENAAPGEPGEGVVFWRTW